MNYKLICQIISVFCIPLLPDARGQTQNQNAKLPETPKLADKAYKLTQE